MTNDNALLIEGVFVILVHLLNKPLNLPSIPSRQPPSHCDLESSVEYGQISLERPPIPA